MFRYTDNSTCFGVVLLKGVCMSKSRIAHNVGSKGRRVAW